jgi:hypothetical protein
MEQQTMTGSGLYIRKHPFLPASAVVALLFGLFCLSALSSCTGCSYNHEKAMGSIDNILGKVDTLMKKNRQIFGRTSAGVSGDRGAFGQNPTHHLRLS